MGSMFFSMTCCRGGRSREEQRNRWSGLHRPVGICVGVTWQGFGSGGTVRVASVRRCQKLPPRWTETILPLYLQKGVDSSWLRVKIFPVQSHQSKSWERPLRLQYISFRTKWELQGRAIWLVSCSFLFRWAGPGMVYNLLCRANSCAKSSIPGHYAFTTATAKGNAGFHLVWSPV